METDNRITAILACLRGDVVGIQDWKEFVKEIKTTLSNKMKAADDKQRIESFKQEKKNMVDFMIEFKALAMKADIDELHTIFLLKKNVTGYYKDDTGISAHCSIKDTQGVEGGNYLSWTRIRVHKRMIQLQNRSENNI